MPIDTLGRVTGGGTPVGKAIPPPVDSTVKRRKATPEELAELDRKLGKPRPKGKNIQGKIINAMDFKELEEKRRKEEPPLNAETIARLRSCCQCVTKEQWERMRAFVAAAGAVRGWDS